MPARFRLLSAPRSLVLPFMILVWASEGVSHAEHGADGSMQQRAEASHLRLQFQNILLNKAGSLGAQATPNGFYVELASGERHALTGPFWEMMIESYREYQSCLISHSCTAALQDSSEPLVPPIQKLKTWLSGRVRYGLHAQIWDVRRWNRLHGKFAAGILAAVEVLETVVTNGSNNIFQAHFLCVPAFALVNVLSGPISFARQSLSAVQIDNSSRRNRFARAYSSFIYNWRYTSAMRTLFSDDDEPIAKKSIAKKLASSPEAVDKALSDAPLALAAYIATMTAAGEFPETEILATTFPLQATLVAALEPELSVEARATHLRHLRAFFKFSRNEIWESLLPLWQASRAMETNARQALVKMELVYKRFDYLLESVAGRSDLDAALSEKAIATLTPVLRRTLNLMSSIVSQTLEVDRGAPENDEDILDLSLMSTKLLQDVLSNRMNEASQPVMPVTDLLSLFSEPGISTGARPPSALAANVVGSLNREHQADRCADCESTVSQTFQFRRQSPLAAVPLNTAEFKCVHYSTRGSSR